MIGDADGNGVEASAGEIADGIGCIEHGGQDERERAGREGFEESNGAGVELCDARGPIDGVDVADERIESGSALELIDGGDGVPEPRVGGESVDGFGGDGNGTPELQESAGLIEIDAWAWHGRARIIERGIVVVVLGMNVWDWGCSGGIGRIDRGRLSSQNLLETTR